MPIAMSYLAAQWIGPIIAGIINTATVVNGLGRNFASLLYANRYEQLAQKSGLTLKREDVKNKTKIPRKIRKERAKIVNQVSFDQIQEFQKAQKDTIKEIRQDLKAHRITPKEAKKQIAQCKAEIWMLEDYKNPIRFYLNMMNPVKAFSVITSAMMMDKNQAPTQNYHKFAQYMDDLAAAQKNTSPEFMSVEASQKCIDNVPRPVYETKYKDINDLAKEKASESHEKQSGVQDLKSESHDDQTQDKSKVKAKQKEQDRANPYKRTSQVKEDPYVFIKTDQTFAKIAEIAYAQNHKEIDSYPVSQRNQALLEKSLEYEPSLFKHIPSSIQTEKLAAIAVANDPMIMNDLPEHINPQTVREEVHHLHLTYTAEELDNIGKQAIQSAQKQGFNIDTIQSTPAFNIMLDIDKAKHSLERPLMRQHKTEDIH